MYGIFDNGFSFLNLCACKGGRGNYHSSFNRFRFIRISAYGYYILSRQCCRCMSPQKEKIYNKIIMTVILGHYKNMPPADIAAGGIFGYKMSAEYK